MTAARRVLGVLWGLAALACFATVLTSAAVGVVSVSGTVRLLGERSGSMAPFIDRGDLVLYRPQAASALKAGQVIAFLRSGSSVPVTHRVVSVGTASGQVAIHTRGDANTSADTQSELFPPTQVVWYVAAVIPRTAPILTAVTGSRGAIFLLSLLPLLFGTGWVQRQLQTSPDESDEPTVDKPRAGDPLSPVELNSLFDAPDQGPASPAR